MTGAVNITHTQHMCIQHVAECEQAIREQQESQVSLSDKLEQQKQWLEEMCSTNDVLEQDIGNLQDAKDRVRNRHCVMYCINTYQVSIILLHLKRFLIFLVLFPLCLLLK